jgi:chemotaxis protein MotA
LVALIGILVVFGSVLGGYLMHGGHLMVLVQPHEYIIILGAAIGGLIIGTPFKIQKMLLGQLGGIVKPGYVKKDYLDLLVMLYELLTLARREGLVALEPHVERPDQSAIVSRYPGFLKNHHAVGFFSDTMRLIISGAGVESHDLEALMDADLESHHAEHGKPFRVLQTMGDALPGLGIVAAVLGIVITMGAINGPPEEIGHKVASALVGTFLGILFSYGLVQPLASNLEQRVDADSQYVLAIKQVLLAFQKGCLPAIAVEFARRSLYSDVRPDFTELEDNCRAAKNSGS